MLSVVTFRVCLGYMQRWYDLCVHLNKKNWNMTKKWFFQYRKLTFLWISWVIFPSTSITVRIFDSFELSFPNLILFPVKGVIFHISTHFYRNSDDYWYNAYLFFMLFFSTVMLGRSLMIGWRKNPETLKGCPQ